LVELRAGSFKIGVGSPIQCDLAEFKPCVKQKYT